MAQNRSACRAAGTAAVGSGRCLWARTTLSANRPVGNAGHAIARVDRPNLPDAPEIRGNFPPRQTKISTGRHSGSTLPPAEEPSFADDSSGVIRDAVLGPKIEAENPARKTLIISQHLFAIPPSRFHALAVEIYNNPRTIPNPPADPLKNMPLELLQRGEGQKMRKVHHDTP
jgi:hypothetical protein